jgi:hypothetical protein
MITKLSRLVRAGDLPAKPGVPMRDDGCVIAVGGKPD